MDEVELQRFSEWFKSMSNVDRLKILLYLDDHNPQASFTTLEEELDLNPTTLSRHLTRMIDVDLIENAKKGEGGQKERSFYLLTDFGKLSLERLRSL